MTSRFAFIFLVLSLTFSPNGYTSDAECILANLRLVVPIRISSSFSKKDSRLISGTIGRIQKLATGLRLPKVRVERDFTPSFSFLEHRIKFDLEVGKPDRLNSMVKVAHEYGHALFDANFEVLFRGKKLNPAERFEAIRHLEQEALRSPSYVARESQLKERIEALKGNLSGLSREERINRANRRLALEKELADLPAKSMDPVLAAEKRQLRSIEQWTLAHNELFADLVAVMAARDGKAVAKALQPGSRAHPDTFVRWSRDFTESVPLKGFQPKELPFPESNVLYGSLEPTRSYLWAQFVSKPSFNEHSRLLQTYLRAVSSQAERNMSKILENQPFDYEDFEAINRELLSFLEREMTETVPQHPS